MLFALYDYIHYRRRSGRFSRDIARSSLMGGAFEGTIPDIIFTELKPGDVFFVQTFSSRISWAIMYLTNSQVSHVAMYLGNRNITHATDAGVVIEPVESFFDSNTRILPCIWHILEDKRDEIEPLIRSKWEGWPYGYRVILIKGLRIIVGRDWPYFRWAFLLDIALILFVLDLPFLLYFRFPVISLLILVYLLIISFNRILWQFKPLKFDENTSYPCQFLNSLYWSGKGTFFFDASVLGKPFTIISYRHRRDDEQV
jgi:hypothetical protein